MWSTVGSTISLITSGPWEPRLKILVLAERTWPEGGGAEQASHLVVRVLSKAGHSVSVLTGTKTPEMIKGVRFVRFEGLDARSKMQLWENVVALRRTFQRYIESSDIVYIPRLAYPIIPTAQSLGKKVVVHLHDYQPLTFEADFFGRESLPSLPTELRWTAMSEILEKRGPAKAVVASLLAPLNRMVRRWLSGADKIICVSEHHANTISRIFPGLAPRVKMIYNMPPEIPYSPDRSYSSKIVYLGGSSWHKGFYTLLSSAALVSPGTDVRIVMAGGYEPKGVAEVSSMNAKNDGRLELVGRISKPEVLSLLTTARGVVCPSINAETFSYSVMEGMLAGLVPVGANVGGIPELVRDTFAESMLFPPSSSGELAHRIEELSRMPQSELSRVGRQIREEALGRFNPQLIEPRILEVFS